MNGAGFGGGLGMEAAVFGQALLTGVVLGVYFDLYRILRRFFRFSYGMVLVQDLLFWLTGAVGVFFASVVVSGGRLRVFFVLTAMVGWGLYAATVGSLLMAVVDVAVKLLRRLFAGVNKTLLSPAASHVRTLIDRSGVLVREKYAQIIKKKRKK